MGSVDAPAKVVDGGPQSPRKVQVPTPSAMALTAERKGLPYCSACKTLIRGVASKALYAHSGWLSRKKSMLHPKTRRWVIVMSGHVLYYEDPKDVGASLPNGVVHLKDGSLEACDEPLMFQLTDDNNSKLVKLEAISETEKRQWMAVIRKQIPPSPVPRLTSRITSPTQFCSDCQATIALEEFTLAQHVGWITKRGGDVKTWKRRWAVVANSHLCYYENPEDVSVFKPLGMLHLSKGAAKPSTALGKEYMFEVECTGRTYFFVVDTQQDLDGWLTTLGYSG
ncbi:PH domain-containing protein [Plasmodiophora brassicae]|uniref:PH domain-containing protein n=1 Tax=Plasmodiophora brassicae TaxID=37360 RepID=A0A0G4ISD0_PLABS|nr:hypothetical protein PBRA_006211 [Plasmodiophora brassicae]SPQ96084.1 unnamed protein product [Plasmodiophora brassicae]